MSGDGELGEPGEGGRIAGSGGEMEIQTERQIQDSLP